MELLLRVPVGDGTRSLGLAQGQKVILTLVQHAFVFGKGRLPLRDPQREAFPVVGWPLVETSWRRHNLLPPGLTLKLL